MYWYKDLYVSNNLSNNMKWIRWSVEHKIHIKPIFLVVLSDMGDGQLEIIPATTLRLPFFEKKEYQVIGVAKGEYHARSLVETIVADVYGATGNCDCKSYFAPYFEKGNEE
ncbi:MAG: hypothetical protein PUB19_01030 [Lachnospiraceae bacterium]|nr:hypothetical protein [Lachnospiraceae bacterium]